MNALAQVVTWHRGLKQHCKAANRNKQPQSWNQTTLEGGVSPPVWPCSGTATLTPLHLTAQCNPNASSGVAYTFYTGIGTMTPRRENNTEQESPDMYTTEQQILVCMLRTCTRTQRITV